MLRLVRRPGLPGGLLARLWLVLFLVFPVLPVQARTAQVESILESLTPEERVGQLFLVAFVGDNAAPGSDVARLIAEERIGGVVLLSSNSNFYNAPDTPRQVADLANALQAVAMPEGKGVPLFVAVDHEGDGYPYTRITGGVTTLPNAMALGATWDLENARAIGQIVGRELAAMGINLLLGPGVDVLEAPRPDGQGDIGTRTFGGDPWWVGQMGRAYVEGVHSGSAGRVATVAKHFPGHGGSDRLPDEEVSTVDKSLEELARVELVPFLALTREDGSPQAVTDALMTSHIRYRGVQGDVRQFTAPLSFDAQGMDAILDLEGFASWRQTGLTVSDSLGVPAVRKYFDPTLTTFPHRRIAKEALLAGNDLLLLAQFDLENNWQSQVENIRDTVAFSRDEYGRDPAFAARVDEAVRRILGVKLRLYPDFSLGAAQVHPEVALEMCGLGTQITQGIADQAVTLLYPDLNALPAPPRRGEKIVILSDARSVRECFSEQCLAFSPLSRTAVEEAILLIYGPRGTGQVDPGDVSSVPFGQLKAFVRGEPTESDVGGLLEQADWIVLAQQDLNPVKGPNSDAARLFLDDPRSAAYRARLVVLAFNAPYYLDTTEISKLSVYLAAYSKTEPFVKAAVRALFGELRPRGASPVDVQGLNYELREQLAPDPRQAIALALAEPPAGSRTPPLTAHLTAGPIVDHNGHPVPDGTTVTFYAEYVDGTYLPPQVASTAAGMAQVDLELRSPGTVLFRAESGEAVESDLVQLFLQAPAPTRTAIATAGPTAGATPAPSATLAAVTSPTPQPTGQPDGPLPGRPASAGDLLAGTSTAGIMAAAGSWWAGRRRAGRVGVVRCLLVAIAGGMAAYVLFALEIVRPDAWGWLPDLPAARLAGLVALVAAGTLLALGLAAPRRGPR